MRQPTAAQLKFQLHYLVVFLFFDNFFTIHERVLIMKKFSDLVHEMEKTTKGSGSRSPLKHTPLSLHMRKLFCCCCWLVSKSFYKKKLQTHFRNAVKKFLICPQFCVFMLRFELLLDRNHNSVQVHNSLLTPPSSCVDYAT